MQKRKCKSSFFFAGMKASTYSSIIYPSFHQSESHQITDKTALHNPTHYATVYHCTVCPLLYPGTPHFSWFLLNTVLHVSLFCMLNGAHAWDSPHSVTVSLLLWLLFTHYQTHYHRSILSSFRET